ncbi:MAG: DUF3347 domain-containing protein [Flavobacterium sp.]|nr:DUF3347 domain-containing protein [Flavobacterium sp.]
METMIISLVSLVLGLLSFNKDECEGSYESVINSNLVTQISFSTEEIVNSYLKIKNALVKSDSKTTAQYATVMETTLNNFNVSQLSASQRTQFIKSSEEAKKHIKVIATNSGKLDKQRKAFQQLSNTISELVTVFGTSEKLHQDFCPMYEGGSIWLSETKEIKNPYYGAQMLNCGKIKEVIE